MYRYTQYVGGNITTKEIPYSEASKLISGLIIDRLREIKNLENSDSSVFGTTAKSDNKALIEQLNKEIESLKADLTVWERTAPEVAEFQERNNLAQT